MMKYSIVITCVDACASLYAYVCKWGLGVGGVGRETNKALTDAGKRKGRQKNNRPPPHPPTPPPPSHPATPFPPLFFWMNKRKLKLVSPAVKTEKTPKPRNKPQKQNPAPAWAATVHLAIVFCPVGLTWCTLSVRRAHQVWSRLLFSRRQETICLAPSLLPDNQRNLMTTRPPSKDPAFLILIKV